MSMTALQLAHGDDFRGLMTAAEAIEFLGLVDHANPKLTLYRLTRTKGLPFVDFGEGCRKYRKCDLQAFIQKKLRSD